MRGSKQISETAKNIMIVLLLLSAVILGWQSQLFGNTSVKLSALTNIVDDKSTDANSGGALSAETKEIGEARPVSITVTGSTGAHYGVKYNLTETKSVYDNALLTFREALGTAQKPVEADAGEWRAALLSPGICYEYMSPIHMSVLESWFGVEMTAIPGSVSVRRLHIAAADGDVRLYYQDDDKGVYYAAVTSVSPDALIKKADAYTASNDNAAFAFEIIGVADVQDPYALIMPDVTAHPKIEVKNPLKDEALTDVLRELGVSEHKKPLLDENGNQIYPEDDFRIVLSPEGTISYRRTSKQAVSSDVLDENGAIEMARQVVAGSIGQYCGKDTRIYFDAVSSSREGDYTVTFNYVAAGGWIYLKQDGYAAEVAITDGIISKMELRFRSFRISEDQSSLLPEIQAAAAAGGAFMLCYTDSGSDILEPSWVVISPNS